MKQFPARPAGHVRMGILSVLTAALCLGLLAATPSVQGAAAAGPLTGSVQDARKELDKRRREALKPLAEMIGQRIAADKARGDLQSAAAFAQLEEQYAIYLKGNMLPGFLREPPAVFAAKSSGKETLRFVAFGDFGDGDADQQKVAAAMRAEHKNRRFDLGITLGDNFYPAGMMSPQDGRWKSQWEDLYAPLKIDFYASLGNHDWLHPDSPAAETLYSLKSDSWHMPSTYYSYIAGPVQFFVLDTEMLTSKQLLWLESQLARSTAAWKIVYGHHPIYSGSREDSQPLIQRLLPVLRGGRIDAYLAGHDHVMAHLKPEDGIEFFVSGGGGRSSYEIRKDNPRMLFGQSAHGFLIVDVSSEQLRFRFIGADNRELYAYTAQKAHRPRQER